MTVSDVEITFRDLEDALQQLKAHRNSPKEVRRAFTNFIQLTQKLTEMMREEYKHKTGKNWNSAKFPGWNDVTEAFKKFRRSDYHEFNILIHVREKQYIAVDHIFGDRLSGGAFLVLEGTWPLDDPFAEEPPQGLSVYRADPQTGKITDVKIEPTKIEYTFLVIPRTKGTQEALEKAVRVVGSNDIHILSESCFQTLKDYFEYYQQCLKSHG